MPETPTMPPQRLVRDILGAGSRREEGEAWSRLMAECAPVLRRVLSGFRCRAGRPVAWELGDLCGELYLHLSADGWRRLRTYQERPAASFFAWVARVAYDLLLQKHRAIQPPSLSLEEERGRDGRPLHETLPAPVPTPEEALLRRETLLAVQAALCRLQHRDCQEVIRRHCYHDERLGDIAEELGMNAPTVRQMYHRNKEELKGLLPAALFAGR